MKKMTDEQIGPFDHQLFIDGEIQKITVEQLFKNIKDIDSLELLIYGAGDQITFDQYFDAFVAANRL